MRCMIFIKIQGSMSAIKRSKEISFEKQLLLSKTDTIKTYEAVQGNLPNGGA